ncbi:MAG: hypothetical protein ACFFCY_16145 [Promethearchaeota archaeon]
MNFSTDEIVTITAIGIVELTEKIDLDKLAKKFVNSVFDPTKLPALQIKLETPKASILLFSTGKMVLTGLKKENDAQIVFDIILDSLNSIGVKYMSSEVKIKKIITRNKEGRITITNIN